MGTSRPMRQRRSCGSATPTRRSPTRSTTFSERRRDRQGRRAGHRPARAQSPVPGGRFRWIPRHGEEAGARPVDAVTGVDAGHVYIDQDREHVASGPLCDPELAPEPERHCKNVYGYYGFTPHRGAGCIHPGYPFGWGSTGRPPRPVGRPGGVSRRIDRGPSGLGSLAPGARGAPRRSRGRGGRVRPDHPPRPEQRRRSRYDSPLWMALMSSPSSVSPDSSQENAPPSPCSLSQSIFPAIVSGVS